MSCASSRTNRGGRILFILFTIPPFYEKTSPVRLKNGNRVVRNVLTKLFDILPLPWYHKAVIIEASSQSEQTPFPSDQEQSRVKPEILALLRAAGEMLGPAQPMRKGVGREQALKTLAERRQQGSQR